MGAVKAAAIEIEINAFQASQCSSAQAYRLGLLEALRLVSEACAYQGGARTPFEVQSRIWNDIYDAFKYLQELNGIAGE